MTKNNVVVALTTDDNDYQREQAAAAEQAAQRLGVQLQIVYGGNDALTQSQQLLSIIQASGARPDAIICEPVGTGMPQVARAAVAAGIAWVMLNREVDYLEELDTKFKVPVFAISSDHQEIGRIQGRQFAALLPQGGHILYLEGPSISDAAKQRSAGMHSTKPANIDVRKLRGNWTETSGYEAINGWLRLSTSRDVNVGLVGSQNDMMARGARKAIQEHKELDSAKWLRVPFTGCDGLPNTGQAWIKEGLLTATVIVPPNTDNALEALVKAFQGAKQPLRTLTKPVSFPPIDILGRTAASTKAAIHKA